MDSSKARIIKANHLLQNKVGMGPVDPKKVEKSQTVIDNNTVDFKPLANEYLLELANTIASAKKDPEHPHAIQKIIEPVMQLKANGKMFGYNLVSELAKIMLDFLEAIDKLDNDVIDIIDAHYTTINAIVTNQMEGDGGEFGRELTSEIKDACKRYFSKMGKQGIPIDNSDAFLAN